MAHQASRLIVPLPLSPHITGLYMRFWWVNFVGLLDSSPRLIKAMHSRQSPPNADMTATQIGMILRNSVESSIVHSLILKHFETFYYNLMRLKDYTRVVEELQSDDYTSKNVMRNIRSWIQNGTTWARLYT